MHDIQKLLKQLTLPLPPGRQRLVIFDLDSTLFCVSYRTQQILRDFARQESVQREQPELARALAEIITTPRDWGIRQAVNRTGIEVSVENFKKMRDFWAHRFFSSDYLYLDQPYAGAVEFVNKVAESGARLLYLTARDIDRMWNGTVKSLAACGFPAPSEKVKLCLKPDQRLSDAEFKAQIISELCPREEEIWYFENEPVIIQDVQKICDKVNIVFVDSVHSGRAESPTDLPVLPMDFNGFN